LLLELIEQNQLDITEISLAKVTDQYLEIVSSKEFPPAQLADFLLIASRLILIKSKILLPFLILTEEEEQEAKELQFALEEYRRYKNQTKIIQRLFWSRNLILSRQLWQGREAVFMPPRKLSFKKIFQTFISLTASLEKFILPEETGYLEKTASVEQRIREIIKKVENQAVLSFNNLVANSAKKIDIIINFLAVLFLFHEKVISLEQEVHFEEIRIKRAEKNES
jgi:segregation and condensation protein A